MTQRKQNSQFVPLEKDRSVIKFVFSSLRVSLNLTFAEFPTERAVKPLTAVLPAHRRAHGGAAPTTSHNALRLIAYWQGHLNTDTHIRCTCSHLLSSAVKAQTIQNKQGRN